MGLTTAAAVLLAAGPAVLGSGGGAWRKLLGDLVLQARHADQETLLVDGLLQGLDVRLHLLLHALAQAAQVTAAWTRMG